MVSKKNKQTTKQGQEKRKGKTRAGVVELGRAAGRCGGEGGVWEGVREERSVCLNGLRAEPGFNPTTLLTLE